MFYLKFRRIVKINKSIVIIFFLALTMAGIPIKNRLLVPVYLKLGLSAGYNDNVFKFSKSEKNSNSSYNYMGNSSTYDSGIMKPEIRLSYSPKLFDDKISRFIYFSSFSNYSNISDKNGFYSSIRFEYKVGAYNWFKIGYKNSQNNFLRYYIDNDIPGEDYLKCDYNSESFFASYSMNFKKYGWSKIEISHGTQLFNPNFTEFDLDISKINFKHYFFINNFNASFMISSITANNSSFLNGLNSTGLDRSYNGYALELKLDKKTNKYFDRFYAKYSFSNRHYLSELASDPLHSGRSHFEHSLSISFLKELRNDIGIELKYKVRYRKTNSEFDWVESLKTFYDNQFLIKITYDTDIDLFY